MCIQTLPFVNKSAYLPRLSSYRGVRSEVLGAPRWHTCTNERAPGCTCRTKVDFHRGNFASSWPWYERCRGCNSPKNPSENSSTRGNRWKFLRRLKYLSRFIPLPRRLSFSNTCLESYSPARDVCEVSNKYVQSDCHSPYNVRETHDGISINWYFLSVAPSRRAEYRELIFLSSMKELSLYIPLPPCSHIYINAIMKLKIYRRRQMFDRN